MFSFCNTGGTIFYVEILLFFYDCILFFFSVLLRVILLECPCADTDPSQDWTLRHGCSMALSVSLKEAPDKIWTPSLEKSVESTINKLVVADRVRVQIFLCLLMF